MIPPVEKGGARLIVRILGDPADEMRSWTDSAEDAVRDRCLAAFARALPDLSADELWFRVRGILAVTAVDRVDFYNQPCFGETIRERWRRVALLGDHVPDGGAERTAVRI